MLAHPEDRSPIPAHARTPLGRIGGAWSSPPIVGAALGLLWYLNAMGWRTLDPTELGWIRGDHAQHLLGWLFFRNEPWTFPLGTVHGVPHPIGTTIGFTDSNPWLSLPFKLLSPWLPVDFQFIGPWLALCFALQGVFGARIMACLTPHWHHQVLGAALFVLSPVLLDRTAHETLCAHFLLLGLIWLHLRQDATVGRSLGLALLFAVLGAGFHPYLAVMVLVLALALATRLWLAGRLTAMRALAFGAGTGLAVSAVFVLFGYIGTGTPRVIGGFGFYSSNLLTFIDPGGYSRWWPSLPSTDGQYEGFGFLGTGVLGLAMAGLIVHRVRRHPLRMPRVAVPLVCAAALMGLYALSSSIYVGETLVVTARSLYETLTPLPETFRASGRFVWPLHYVTLLGILAMIVRPGLLRPSIAAAALLAAVLVQAAEVVGVWGATRAPVDRWARMEDRAWEALGPPYRHLVLYPAHLIPELPGCPASDVSYEDMLRLWDVAYRQRLTFNSAYVARHKAGSSAASCERLRADLMAGRVADDTVYVAGPQSIAIFVRMGSRLTCGTLDGFHVCVSSRAADPFRRLLAAATGGTISGAPLPAGP